MILGNIRWYWLNASFRNVMKGEVNVGVKGVR